MESMESMHCKLRILKRARKLLTDDSVELLAVVENERVDLGVRRLVGDALALHIS